MFEEKQVFGKDPMIGLGSVRGLEGSPKRSNSVDEYRTLGGGS